MQPAELDMFEVIFILNYFFIFSVKIEILFFSSTDLLVGGLDFYSNHLDNFKPSRPYLWDETIICLKNPEFIARWIYLFLMTNPMVWLLGISIFCIASSLWYIFSGFEENQTDLWKSILFVIGCAVLVTPPLFKYVKKCSHRLIFEYIAWGGFFITCIYLATFYKILLEPKYQSKILSTNDLTGFEYLTVNEEVFQNKGKHCLAVEMMIGFCWFFQRISLNSIKNGKRCDDIDACFQLAQDTMKTAVIISKLQFDSSKWISDFYCIKESKNSSMKPISLFIRNDSKILAEMDEIIQWTLENDLVAYWTRSFQSKMKPKSHAIIRQVAVEDLASILFITPLLLLFATLVFISENVIYRKCQFAIRSGQQKSYWIWLSRFVDADRYIVYWKADK